MKKLAYIIFLLALPGTGFSQQALPPYKDKKVPVENRIEDLLKRMTLEEKIFQTNQWTYGKNANANNIEASKKAVRPEIGSLIYRSINPVYRNEIQKKAMQESRLGIPILMGFDVNHGYRTIFPIPLAQACSWNTELVTQACEVAAKESKLSGVDWTFSPMVDVARDARWGRVAEGYGEDPYANAVFAVASIKGYQGKNLSDPYSIAACIKHYIGYSLSEGGRDYRYSDVSNQTLWETFMPPYEAGVKAGAATLMSAFNDISGVPASANFYTLTEILKRRWKHDGFVVSDWGSVENLIPQGFAKDRKDAALKSFMSGVEMDMVDNVYVENLKQLVDDNKIPLSSIDEAVRRILRVKFRLGLFDKPYVEELPEKDRYYAPESLALAEKLAEESMVLLKNNNQALPLSVSVKQIALIGPMVKDRINLMGSWEGQGIAESVETLFEGFEKEFKGKAILHYARGCEFDGTNEAGFEEALIASKKSNVIILCMGEMKKWSGENASRSTIALPAIQVRLIETLKKAGKPIILILSNGRPLELGKMESLSDAILEIWQPGIAGGSAVAGIVSGRLNPSGKLAITFPLTTGQIPTYYNMRQSARPKLGGYQDVSSDPKYGFGHGLSYTTFSYGKLILSDTIIKKGEKLIASIEITNSGLKEGKETAMWFIADPVASITRPVKELKHFEKQLLKAGEKKIFKFELDPMRDLSFPDGNGIRHLESGAYYLMIQDQKVKFELVDGSTDTASGYHQVKARANANSPTWKTYTAKTIDRLPGFSLVPDPPLNNYGSWKTDPSAASGFFRVEKKGQRWWIVDPEGYPFIHKGVAVFRPGNSSGQKSAMTSKYGSQENWVEQETGMLKSNGFNGTGAWSGTDLIRQSASPLVYTVIVNPMASYKSDHIKKYGGKYEVAGWQGYRYDLVMVFDPEFDSYIEKSISVIAKYATDKNLLGYFTDNELPWKNDALDRHLNFLSKNEPGYIVAKKWLDERKGKDATIADVTDEDRLAFTGFYFEAYIKKVAAAVRKYDPNHLYLGCRFNQEKEELSNPEIFKVAGKYMDMISINHYRKWEPEQSIMHNWTAWSGKPFIITEWYTKGEDSGLPNRTGAGWNVPTQQDRGYFYQNFTIELLKSKTCVGWHWFTYQDNDPLDTSTDPSNRDSNKGIVNSQFVPWAPLLENMKELNTHVYELIKYLDK